MKHPFNGKVRLYYVGNNIVFKSLRFSEKIKTSLFVSVQRRDLSSCARLWRLNRPKKTRLSDSMPVYRVL